jgi:hypothetical protein
MSTTAPKGTTFLLKGGYPTNPHEDQDLRDLPKTNEIWKLTEHIAASVRTEASPENPLIVKRYKDSGGVVLANPNVIDLLRNNFRSRFRTAYSFKFSPFLSISLLKII